MKAGMIAQELKLHAPFTMFGTVTGIVIFFLSLALRLPCCTSDIVFPLFWIKPKESGIL